ncbi:aldehyde dehydrogenase family protein [Gordonia jinghuaiqii]|uniref:aldehyde dehydrogenase (NAD(+)) n=1 Tax=Gordonia jinghuaiqii TaxID=2758710 RepID=A0A7D7LTQ9_9ACTN|nr:aldehyde dehydrogenase [Gordonia jinghuaiqii]MCR5978251.1 aldehyde dehydrogenase family protein [Gordonia jinghuaiqii]QMT01301.1 aldehyde dehydrogenase [Gordonia jinghuaiqii]
MTVAATVTPEVDRLQFFVGGKWVDASSTDTHEVLEAATGEPIARAALGSEADVESAIVSAHESFAAGEWSRATAEERATVLRRFADALEAKAEATSVLVSREIGMPIELSRAFNGVAPAHLLRQYADVAVSTATEEIRRSPMGSTIIRREPVGVAAVITPWNYPQAKAMISIAPALAAGCSVVLKHSPDAALDSYVIAEAAQQAGLPAGVLNVVLADREPASLLSRHPLVDKVAFTGSTASGERIGAEAGRRFKRVTLELGGKSAAIVLEDADLDVFVTGMATAAFMNNGQTCTGQSRILAPQSRYDEIVDALAGWAGEQILGNPLDPAVTIGPMANQRQLQRVSRLVEVAISDGARLVHGGGRPAGLDRGWFMEPTILADVSNTDRIAREEIFGPVVTVIPYTDLDDAISMANDSDYGLAGSVWTADEQRGIGVARRVRTGTFGINYYVNDFDAPFGGVKRSGIGRELGPEGFAEFQELKSIYASAALLDRD